MQMSATLNYLLLKYQAIALLVLGRRQAALTRFEQMLALVPRDRYALASRAHLLGQMGDKPAAIAALPITPTMRTPGSTWASCWKKPVVLRMPSRLFVMPPRWIPNLTAPGMASVWP
jgi:hypothetical protein